MVDLRNNDFKDNDDFTLVGIALENEKNKEDFSTFVNEHEMKDWVHFYSLDDEAKMKVTGSYAIEFIPTMYLIDKEGKIHEVVDSTSGLAEKIKTLIAQK